MCLWLLDQCLWFFDILNVQHVFVILCQYRCDVSNVRFFCGVNSGIIIDTKKLILLYGVIVYHECIFRRQILDCQLCFALLGVYILVCPAIYRQVKAVVTVHFIRPGVFQGICKCCDIIRAFVTDRIADEITAGCICDIFCMIAYQPVFPVFVQNLMSAFVIIFQTFQTFITSSMFHDQMPDCLLVRICFIPLIRRYCKNMHIFSPSSLNGIPLFAYSG